MAIRVSPNRCSSWVTTWVRSAQVAALDAVADARIDPRRYESYVKMFSGDDYV